MKRLKINSGKREARNLGITVLASTLTLIFASIAGYTLTHPAELWGYGLVSAFLAIISLIVAIYGRKSLFVALAELLFLVP